MKNITFSSIALFAAIITAGAQNFQGMAVYEAKTSTSDLKMEAKGITPEMQKMIADRMKKAFEKTFILNFDKSSSIYQEEEKLDAPGTDNAGMRMMASFTGGGGKHYKNVKERSYTIEKEIFGKEFLVKDTLAKLNWKMDGSESKKIGNYTCYKATAVVPVSKSDFRNLRMKKSDAKEDEKKAADKTTNFMDRVEMAKDVTITAWYAPEIPVNQGPENYWGLPGLILEVTDGRTSILCSKVIMNTKEKADIKAPTKGKVVTQAEYDDVVLKKMQEMQEMFRSRGAGDGMRIGG
jgi:GLPGLI family protein